MYKKSCICKFAMCQRLLIMTFLWVFCLVGANELRKSAQADDDPMEQVKRLAIYSFAVKSMQ